MARNISQAAGRGTDLFTRDALPEYERTLQYGTPKWSELGVNKACYAMLSNNSSSTMSGAVFFDKYFQQIRSSQVYNYPTVGNVTNINASTDISQIWNTPFNGIATTSSQVSTSGSANWLHSTVSAGEFGNACVDVFSNVTLAGVDNRIQSGHQGKHDLNRCFVNSDHFNRAVCYIQQGTRVRAVSRLTGDALFDLHGTRSVELTDIHTSSMGGSSYNATRKEFVNICQGSSTTKLKVNVWKNVDFDTHVSPHKAFAQELVHLVQYEVNLPSVWPVNDLESRHNLKITLCDTGRIFMSVFFTSNSLKLYDVVLNEEERTGAVEFLSSLATTTAYGLVQGAHYGQRSMQSRDGSSVVSYAPYYYYGSGLVSHILDKRKGDYLVPTAFNQVDTGNGLHLMPYGDSGFTCWYAGNAYAGNPRGGWIKGAYDRNADGDIEQCAGILYMSYFTLPNTTNYPGMTQVVDYSMLTNQTLYVGEY